MPMKYRSVGTGIEQKFKLSAAITSAHLYRYYNLIIGKTDRRTGLFEQPVNPSNGALQLSNLLQPPG